MAGWQWVRQRLVLAAPLTPEATASAVLHLADRAGHAHATFGLEGVPTLVRLRGHLAFRGPVDRSGLLTKYCERVFGPTPACELNIYD